MFLNVPGPQFCFLASSYWLCVNIPDGNSFCVQPSTESKSQSQLTGKLSLSIQGENFLLHTHMSVAETSLAVFSFVLTNSTTDLGRSFIEWKFLFSWFFFPFLHSPILITIQFLKVLSRGPGCPVSHWLPDFRPSHWSLPISDGLWCLFLILILYVVSIVSNICDLNTIDNYVLLNN